MDDLIGGSGAGRPSLREGQRLYVLSSSAPTVIGRQSCAILLGGSGVAARHARVSPSRQGFLIEPLEAEVLVNGTPLRASSLLRPGDDLTIGSVHLIYEGPTPADVGAAGVGYDEIYEAARECVVSLHRGPSVGSGFFLRPDGLLVTNRHVVGYQTTIAVQLAGGRRSTGVVVRSFPDVDLAFVRVEGARPSALPLSRPGSLRVGQAVLALGNPHGLSNTLTRGIISALDRQVCGSLYLQTDAAIHPGSSGGPLLNEHAEVVGVTTLGLNGAPGLNFALPAEIVGQRLQRLRAEEARLRQGHGVYCPICGLLSAGGTYCPDCGVKMGSEEASPPAVSCSRCGKSSTPGDRFCSGCGWQV